MTRRKPLQRTVALLLCVFLCLGAAFSMMGAAYAADLEPPASGVTIEIMLPSDWASTSAAAKVCITDQTGGGFASAEVRIDRGGSWRNITASLEQREDRYYGVVDITDNCTVYVRVTGHDGEVYENSRYMECFDRTPPTVRASISGNVLRVEASDNLSGVTEITVGGKCYTNLTGGTLDVSLKDLGTAEQISVQAADSAGNRSQAVQVKNPNYQAPANSKEPAAVQKPAATTPVTTTPGKAPTTTTQKLPDACTPKNLMETELLAVVSGAIRQHMDTITALEKRVSAEYAAISKEKKRTIDRQIAQVKQEQSRSQNLLEGLYQNLVEGLLTREEYPSMKAHYQKRYDDATRRLEDLNTQLQQLERYSPSNPMFAVCRTLRDTEGLSEELIHRMIARIEVHDENCLDIKMFYQDEVEALLRFLREGGTSL